MKSRIIKYLIIFLAISSIATKCTEDEEEAPEPDYTYDVKYTVTPDTGTINTTFTFTITKAQWWITNDENNKNEFNKFKWQFYGDDLWDTEFTSEKTITQVYTSPDTYTVTLWADHSIGINTYVFKQVVVTDTTNSPPVAEFEGTPTNGIIPLTVIFTDQSTNNPTSWQWDFGNGESSQEQNPTYTYNDVGTYTIKLTATNNYGSDDEEKVDYISVSDGSNTCPGLPIVTDIDGNAYNTVWIEGQCWMKENLKTTKYNDGTEIPNVEDGTAWKDLITGAYVWYENDSSWKDKYGAMYNWYAVDDAKGLCPTDWHVPSKEDWLTLEYNIGSSGVNLAQKLRSCRQVNSSAGGDCNTTIHPRWDETFVIFGGFDEFELSLLPGGYRATSYFYSLGSVGGWWTSTQDNDAWFRSMEHDASNLHEYLGEKNRGYSVRCLKDD